MRQTKPGWQKQKEKEEKREKKQKEKKEEFRKPTVEEKMEMARVIEKKEEEEEEDLIEIRMVEEMVPRQFHKYLKVFEKKESERMPIRKTWDHAIDLREGFVPKKEKIYLLSRIEREEV